MVFVKPLILLLFLSVTPVCLAFESDVHYGLTYWLARQAGFDEREARTIAGGSQRVDSGAMQFIDVVYMYACLDEDDVGAKRAGAHHYPTSGPVPGAPQARTVRPGSDAAIEGVLETTGVPAGKAGFMLLRLGERLHVMQDAWAHQGEPDVPQPGASGFRCDPTRAWGHPKARGGASSHKADLTHHWPADTKAAARLTYGALLQYPTIAGKERRPRDWSALEPLLDDFIVASSKSAKRAWFAAQGIEDVSFLEGTSLPDGERPFTLKWDGRRLPPVPTHQSRQHHVDAALLDFYHRVFERWMTTQDFDTLARDAGAGNRAELAAQLRLWRLRDHGRVAGLAHACEALTPKQRGALAAIAAERGAYVAYESYLDAFFPLLPRTEDVSPLLPFFVATPSADTAVAVAKLRHAPYDSIAVLAHKRADGWRVTSVASTVDH